MTTAPIHLRTLQGTADLIISLVVLVALLAGFAAVRLGVGPRAALFGDLAIVLAPLLYPGLLEVTTGATPVMHLFRLKVVGEDGNPPSVAKAWFRALLKVGVVVAGLLVVIDVPRLFTSLGWVLAGLYVIGAALQVTRERNPWFHDFLSRTTVVRVSRGIARG